jgi:hypothetical protein
MLQIRVLVYCACVLPPLSAYVTDKSIGVVCLCTATIDALVKIIS